MSGTSRRSAPTKRPIALTSASPIFIIGGLRSGSRFTEGTRNGESQDFRISGFKDLKILRLDSWILSASKPITTDRRTGKRDRLLFWQARSPRFRQRRCRRADGDWL